jgi:hypothetical protein
VRELRRFPSLLRVESEYEGVHRASVISVDGSIVVMTVVIVSFIE